MNYSYYAFLDVMGYKEYLNSDMRNGTTAFKDKLVASFRVFEEVGQGNIHYKSISDSIFVSSPNSVVEFLATIKKVYISFLRNGLLLRGGIAYERHFENNSITYSLALTEAYNLESKHSLYPRILIQPAIIEKAKNEKAQGTNNNMELIANNNLTIKCGDYYQLHIVDSENWMEVYDGLKMIYDADGTSINANPKLLAYYTWLHNYLFSFKPKEIKKQRFINEFQPISA